MAAMTLRPGRFAYPPYSVAEADRLTAQLGVSPAMAAILARRGYADPDAARSFLEAAERHDPFTMAGMEGACELILGHLRRGTPMLVFGDYDVDGVCSTAILLRALRVLGADPAWELPSRQDGGYGLSAAAVERFAAQGVGLLVTVDCGITAVAELATATALGIDVLVTDHHRPGAELPDCPIVHPALGGYPCPDLCAAGVALKLSEALRTRAGLDPLGAEEDLDLAALATACDLVPLRGENRRIVREGLRELARPSKPGLRALLRAAALEPGEVDAHALAFRLGPRLNAAGRLRRADPALELLLTGDERRAAEIAVELDDINRERREEQLRILIEAEAACLPQLDRAALVVAGEGWHQGVVGIVASKLVERFCRPSVVIALDGDAGRGSARSIPSYDLHEGLAACGAHLERFGGHRMAAGLEVAVDAVEPFARSLAAHAAARLSPRDLLPVAHVDAIVPGGRLGLPLAEELARLEPFGAGNPRPTLLVPAARIGVVAEMGEERDHSRFTLENGGARARGVAFRTTAASLARLAGERSDLAVTLEENSWNGMIEPRVVLKSFAPTRPGECLLLGEDEPFWVRVGRQLEAALEVPLPGAAPPVREIRDRRDEGFAGVVGDLLSSGERVLVVTWDVPRRRDPVAALVGGLAAGRLGLVGWEELWRSPSLAAEWPQVVALDPPLVEGGDAALAALPSAGAGFAYLNWGMPEAQFALACMRAGLELRPALADAYRALRGAPGGATALASALRGQGRRPRSPEVCGRMLRVLIELHLLDYVAEAEGGPSWTLSEGERRSLDSSRAYRAYRGRLRAAEACLREERPGVLLAS
jgi:single-stranded-DNA-specific exonuclease